MKPRTILGLSLSAIAFVLAPVSSEAQTPEEFYKGKTVFLQIGSGVGGGYDTMGRLVQRHIGKHIPGKPNVVPQNIPSGGSLKLANMFGNVTPRDGSIFGVFNNGMPMTPLLTPSAAMFDPLKFNFIGSPLREGHVLITWNTAPVKTVDELFTKELITGATAPGAAPYEFTLLNNIINGTKFKIVTGYKSGSEVWLAMERGETQAYAGLAWNSAKVDYGQYLESKQAKVLAAFGMKKHPDLMDVPLLPVGKTEEDRQLFQLMYARQAYGRPFAAPPEVPADRVKALRDAFAATMKDDGLLAEAKKMKVDIAPVTGEELTQLTIDLHRTPKSVVDRMRTLLSAASTKK